MGGTLKTQTILVGIICLAAFLLSAGCMTGAQVKSSSTSAEPDWLDGTSSQYPVSKYLIGVGLANYREPAEAEARAEIARIFKSEVTSRQKVYQEYVQVISKGGENVEDSISVQNLTEVVAGKVMNGVRIAEVYDAPDGMYYALAVLERGPASEQLEEKIRELDRSVLDEWNRAQTEQDKILRLRFLSRSLNYYLERDALNAELGVIGRRTIQSEINGAELKAQVESELFSGTTLGVVVTGSRAADIKSALIEVLNNEGFTVGGTPNPDVLIRVNVKIEPLDRADPQWKWALWSLSLEMTDAANGKIFGSYQKTDRESHLTWQSAQERAVRAVNIALKEEVGAKVRSYLLGK